MRTHNYNPQYTVADYNMWDGDWELIDGTYHEQNQHSSSTNNTECTIELSIDDILASL